MMLVEIHEEFMAIILDIHMWRMLLDFAITCGRGLSREKKADEMKIMDEEYHQLFKDLCRESHAFRQAAVEDKGTIISRTLKIAKIRGSTSGLDYLRAIYLQSWLTGSAIGRELELKKYEYVNVLGQGGSGTVLKVKWLGVECALKVLRGQDEKEAIALKVLFHPNIIRLFHYWEDHPENPQSCLLMELMPQDLGAYMESLLKGVSSLKMQMGKDSMPFSLLVAIDIMYQIAQAMRYMHDKHLTHRDLKPANILVKERPQVGLTCIDGGGYLDIKLADFGLVKFYTNTSTFQSHSRNKGTGMYRAPEIFGKDMAQKRHYMPMADVWSFGITCAEILSGKAAYAKFVDDYGSSIQAMICKEGLRPPLPKHCPPYLAFCIKSCWEFLPSCRPTFASICKLLRHAQLLSLGVMKMDESKFFFAYTTRSDQVQSLTLSPSSLRARASTFFQSSLKFMGIGPRPVRSVAEVLPAAAITHEVRLVPTPLITEDSPELNEDVGGGIVTLGRLMCGERHYSAVLPVADIVHEERVFSTPMVTEECPLANEGVAGSTATLANPTQMVKSLPDLQEPAHLTQTSLDNAIFPPDTSDPIQPAITPRKKVGRVMLTTKADGGKFAKDCAAEEEVAAIPSENLAIILDDLNDYYPGSSFSDNVSPEANGYQIRAPPPRSRQDDVTGPSPFNLLMAVVGVKSAVTDFAEVLITDMKKHAVELEYLNQTIVREVRANVGRDDHWKFLVQAFICKRFFDGFNAPNRYFGIDDFEMDQMTNVISFADFSKFKDKADTISMLLVSDSLDGSFIGTFCFKKFKSIIGELASNQPLPIYQEEWDAVERECHPKTVFYQSFLKVAISVWLVHRLVHSFEEKVEMLIYEKGAEFQSRTMKSVEAGSYRNPFFAEVSFLVFPGFQVSDDVVKCEVYLRNRNSHTDMEITGETPREKAPVKTPSNRPPGKTLSAKTSVKPRISPRLPQPQPIDHYPPTSVGDAGSSGFEVHPYWDARRDSLTPADMEDFRRTCPIFES